VGAGEKVAVRGGRKKTDRERKEIMRYCLHVDDDWKGGRVVRCRLRREADKHPPKKRQEQRGEEGK